MDVHKHNMRAFSQNYTVGNGSTMLHFLTLEKNYHAIDFILLLGGNFNSLNKLNQTPFDIAMINNDRQTLEVLMNYISTKSIKPKIYKKLLTSLINYSSKTKNSYYYHLIEQLFSKDVKVNVSKTINNTRILYDAVYKGHRKLVKNLLEQGASVSSFITEKNSDGQWCRVPILYGACEKGRTQMVKILLENGVNYVPKSSGTEQYYPMHVAISKQYYTVVRQLLKQGIDVNQDCMWNNGVHCSALHLACSLENFLIVKMLISYGADVNIKDNEGHMPIIRTILTRSEDIFAYLVQCDNFRVDFKNADFILYWTIELHYDDMFQIFYEYIQNLSPNDSLRKKIETNLIYNCKLKLPLLHKAAIDGSVRCLEVLLKSGVDVDMRNRNGRTALHLAFRYRKIAAIAKLLEYGADIRALCNNDFTPLDYSFDTKLYESRYDTDEEDEEQVENDQESLIIGFLNHPLMMLMLNLPLKIDNLSYICRLPIADVKMLLDEINGMKQDVISNGITYYDIAKADISTMNFYLKKREILEVLSSPRNYNSKYPDYAVIIGGAFQRGLARKKLLDKFIGLPIFKVLLQKLGYSIVKRVLDFFNNTELKLSIDFYKYPPVCEVLEDNFESTVDTTELVKSESPEFSVNSLMNSLSSLDSYLSKLSKLDKLSELDKLADLQKSLDQLHDKFDAMKAKQDELLDYLDDVPVEKW